VYSLRARENPTVSTPVKWEEVEHMLKKKDASLLVFEAGEVLKRVEKMGDLFEPALALKQKLPKSAEDVGASAPARAVGGARRASKPEVSLEIAAQADNARKTVRRKTKKTSSR
jgi:bifunctional non-homologous end joining protein LigD